MLWLYPPAVSVCLSINECVDWSVKRVCIFAERETVQSDEMILNRECLCRVTNGYTNKATSKSIPLLLFTVKATGMMGIKGVLSLDSEDYQRNEACWFRSHRRGDLGKRIFPKDQEKDESKGVRFNERFESSRGTWREGGCLDLLRVRDRLEIENNCKMK